MSRGNTDMCSNGIESAFETMVQRWLIQGASGEWQLLPKKTTSKKFVLQGDCGTRPRKQTRDKVGSPTGVHPKQVGSSYPTHINRKLTADFLQRSKMRLLNGLESGHETSKCGQSPARCRPRNDVDADKNPSKTENGRVKYLSTEAKKVLKPSESVVVFNDEVPPRGGTSTIEPTISGKLKGATTSRSRANASTIKDQPNSSGVHNAKVEMETEECRRITRNAMSTQAESTAAIGKVFPEQASDGIPILCNGLIKCKIEYCYKAACRGGLCAGHEEDDTCVARGCNNLPYSQGLCRAHVGCKPRPKDEDCNGAVQKTTITKEENSEGAESKVVSHEESSNSKSAVAIPQPADIEVSSSSSPNSSRPKLQTAKEQSKPPASNAWHSSDLPRLFRAAGHKRERRTKQAVASFKREKIGHAGTAVARRTCKRSRDDHPKVCKVRGCLGEMVSDGFCQKHAKCKRCKEDGCGNLAAKGTRDFCWRHAAKKCQIDGCTKRARVRGRCSNHGGRYVCREEGCSKTVYSQGLCVAHFRQTRDQPAKQSAPQKKRLIRDARCQPLRG